MQSPKYTLNSEDMKKIGMAMVYSGLAAALTYLGAALEQVEIPAQYMFLVPMWNAMLYTVVKFIQGKTDV